MDHASHVRAAFKERYGVEPRIFRAPGRVNLIGEHTDYNQGFVMPAAIGFATWVAIATRADSKLAVCSLDFNESREFDLRDENATPKKDWSDYIRGVAFVLRQAGHHVSGANIAVHGNVPIGAGLSSSAAIEVATALALLSVNGTSASQRELALLCQRAENEFVGARCGIMDQFVSVHGRAGHGLMLDCRSLEYQLIPVPERVSLVICNTMIKHDLAAGEYNARRAECEEGVRRLREDLPEIASLRDVSIEQLESEKARLPEMIYRRCRHVVTENERVLKAATAFQQGRLSEVGALMRQSHVSLRDDYEVSCTELDIMFDIASGMKGVLGSRMTGGGFGGCTINLVEEDAVEKFRAGVAREYKRETGIAPDIYVTTAAQGATEVR